VIETHKAISLMCKDDQNKPLTPFVNSVLEFSSAS